MPEEKKKNRKKEREEKLAFDVIGLAGVDGLGFSKAAELHVRLGVKTVHELYKACKDGKVAELEGCGAEKQEKLKSAIELSVLWFQSNAKKAEKKQQENIVENMAKAVGISSELMREIAEAHEETNNEDDTED